jgi:hypothetical protein
MRADSSERTGDTNSPVAEYVYEAAAVSAGEAVAVMPVLTACTSCGSGGASATVAVVAVVPVVSAFDSSPPHETSVSESVRMEKRIRERFILSSLQQPA